MTDRRLIRLRSSCAPTLSLDAFHSNHLRIGDVVSLYALDSKGHNGHEGFLSTLGLVDGRCVVEEGSGSLQAPPETFRDCLYRICPVNRYAAQKQFWAERKKFQQGDIVDEEMLAKLRVAADKEKEQNELEYRKMLGSLVQYGSSIQLLHVRSDKFVTMQKNSPARQERNAMRVYLDRQGNDGSWFLVDPVYKHVSLGDNVMSGERISLVPYAYSTLKNSAIAQQGAAKLQLHLSQQRLADHGHCWEVNCLNEQTEWQAHLFLQFDENVPEHVKSGDVLRLFHADQQTFLTLDTEPKSRKDQVFLRLTNRPSATDATSSRALWEIQVHNREMALRGGAASWRRLVRFKHLATDQYLTCVVPTRDRRGTVSCAGAVCGTEQTQQQQQPTVQFQNVPPSPADNESPALVLVPKRADDPNRNEDLLFLLDPCTKVQTKEARVPTNSYVRLQHLKTGTWVHSTNPMIKSNLYYSGKNEKGWVRVVSEAHKIDKEAFALSPVSPDEVRDLDFANDACRALHQFVELIRSGRSVGKGPINFTSQLLTECIQFVTDTHNHLLDPLAIVNFTPIRDRQKLLREQGVLAQVFALLKAPFLPRQGIGEVGPLLSSPQELTEARNGCFRRMFQLSYSLLRYSQADYRKNQEFLAEKFDQIQEQVGFNLLAEDTMTSVLHNNPKLLEKYVKAPHVERFVELVRNNRCGKFLLYLADLCVCRGEANKKVQELICNSVLNERNRNIFLLTEMCPVQQAGKFEVYIRWSGAGSSQKSLVVACSDPASEEDRQMVDYYRHQLDLMAQMCQDQQYLAIDPPPERKLLNIGHELPVDLVLQCMSDTRLPFDMRASFCRLMLHLHVVRGSLVPPIRHARLWREIPGKVGVKSYQSTAAESFRSENGNRGGGSRHGFAQFHRDILDTVDSYLAQLRRRTRPGEPVLKDLAAKLDENRLTFELVNLARALAQFGFYEFEQLLRLVQNLLAIVDSRPASATSAALENGAGGGQQQQAPMAHQKLMRRFSKRLGAGIQQQLLGGTRASICVPPTSLHLGQTQQQAKRVKEAETAAEDAAAAKQSREILLQTKLIVAELIHFITDVRRDFRITVGLSFFKEHFPCNEEGQMPAPPAELDESLVESLCRSMFVRCESELDLDRESGQQLLRILLQMTMSDFAPLTNIALKLLFRHFSQFQELMEDMKQVQLLVSNRDVENYRQVDSDLFMLKQLTEKSELWVQYGRQLDGSSTSCSSPSNPSQERSDDDLAALENGTASLQEQISIELANLAAADISPTESATARRRRTLLISRSGPQAPSAAREAGNKAQFLQQNYPKLVRSLGPVVENLGGDSQQQQDKAELNTALHTVMEKAPLLCYLLVKEILVRMKNLCFDGPKSQPQNQQLLRNMRVYEVILDFLCIPYDRKNDAEMSKLVTLSHEFLRSFCRQNKENQARLYSHIAPTEATTAPAAGDQQRREGGRLSVETVEECATLVAIFRNNAELCEKVPEQLIAHIVGLIEHKQRNAVFLELLQWMVGSCEKGLDLCQVKVVEEISKASDDVRQFYVDSASFEQLMEMMRSVKSVDLDAAHPLRYHIELVRLLALCTKGRNESTELKCASFLPIDHLVRVLTSKDCLIEAKAAYLQFMLHCYIDTDCREIELKDPSNAEFLEAVLDDLSADMTRLCGRLRLGEPKSAVDIVLERYICQSVTDLLIRLFDRPAYSRDSSSAFFDIRQHQKRFIGIVQRLGELQAAMLRGPGQQCSKNWYRLADCSKRLGKLAKEWGILLPANNLGVPHQPSIRGLSPKQRWQSAAFSARFIKRNQQQSRASRGPFAAQSGANVVCLYQQLVQQLQLFMCPLKMAESSVLVDVLHLPEKLFAAGRPAAESSAQFSRDNDGVRAKLIQHCLLLLEAGQEQLCGRVLLTLCRMASRPKLQSFGKHGKAVRRELLLRYFGAGSVQGVASQPVQAAAASAGVANGVKNAAAAAAENLFDPELRPIREISLSQMQCRLAEAGAVDLVIDLLVLEPGHDIFQRSVQLAKALLHGGNHQVQVAFHHRLQDPKLATRFFRILMLKMQAAQNRIKCDMMSGVSSRARPSAVSTSVSRRSSALVTPNPSHGTHAQLSARSSVDLAAKSDQNQRKRQSMAAEKEKQPTAEAIEPPILSLPSVPSSPHPGEDHQQELELPLSAEQRSSRGAAEDEETGSSGSGANEELAPEVALIEPILRFLQLLCENHNAALQNFLRTQKGRPDYNLVTETLTFLDCVCGSTKGSLGVFAEIGEHNFSLITQTLITLTEFCQGPCHENQSALAMHESNGLDMIISLVLNDIRPLADQRMELALEIKSQASKLLLAIMESRHDSENADRVLRIMAHASCGARRLIKAITAAHGMASSCQALEVAKMRQQLLAGSDGGGDQHFQPSTAAPDPSNFWQKIIAWIWHQPRENPSICLPQAAAGSSSPIGGQPQPQSTQQAIVDPKEVGHNIYILAHQLSRHNEEMARLLHPDNAPDGQTREALTFYREHTAQIEIVRADRKLERVIFPLNDICGYLTPETKHWLFVNTEKDAQGSKVTEFFDQWPALFEEMKWQRKLQSRPLLSACTSRLRLWSRMGFFLAVLLNLILALAYPFDHLLNAKPQALHPGNPFIYLSFMAALFHLWSCCPDWHSVGLTLSSQLGIFAAMVSSTLLLTALVGLLPTIWLLGLLQLINKCVHVASYAGNRGFVERPWRDLLADSTALYHTGYLLCCLLGLLIHPFIYALLLFDIIACEETLRNVIRSVTRNWQSIILTGLLALILVYHFSIIGYLFFQRDFRLEVHKLNDNAEDHRSWEVAGASAAEEIRPEAGQEEEEEFFPQCNKLDADCNGKMEEENHWTSKPKPIRKCKNGETEEGDDEDEQELKVPSCETLRMCILTTLNWGLRNGGGIGDVLRSVSPHEPYFFWRILYDMTFYIVLIIIVLNLIFGVIIDTFGDLRTEKNEKDFTLRNTCFICGLERGRFDNKAVTFEEHNEQEHNLWHYIYFIVWLQIKDETEFTGPESYVAQCVKQRNLDWFPRMQAISLQEEEAAGQDQLELRDLQLEMRQTQETMRELGQRVQELQMLLESVQFG